MVEYQSYQWTQWDQFNVKASVIQYMYVTLLV